MDLYRKESAKRFGIWLRLNLKTKHPQVKITADFLASQYNLRAFTSDTISNETARKWLNGTTLPSVHRFQILKSWFGADAVFLATCDEINRPAKLTNIHASSEHQYIESITSKMSQSNLFNNAQIEFILSLSKTTNSENPNF
jgi:hypothetical protein